MTWRTAALSPTSTPRTGGSASSSSRYTSRSASLVVGRRLRRRCRLSSVVASVVARAPARPSRARPAPAPCPCLHALVPPFSNLSPKPLPKTTADARQGYLSRRLVIVVAVAPALSRRRRGAGSALRSGRYAVGAVAYGLQLVGLNVRAALLPLHVFLGLF